MYKFALPILLAFYTNSTALAEGNYDKGEELAKTWSCTHCHGLTGNDRSTEIPGAMSIPMLAGQPTVYLVRTMNQYKTGARIDDHKASRMPERAKALSDQDIEDISAYFSAQKRY
jgi:cytochrome c553